MKLSKSFELGLAIILIVAQQPDNSAIPATKIANQLQSSLTYSQKLLRKLVIAGLIKATPGNNGGFILAKSPDDITLADIVVALDGNISSYQPSGVVGIVSNSSNLVASQAIHTADLVWYQVLSQTSLASLLR